MKKDKISVIIRTRNEERWIGYVIQSVIGSLDKPEIIIVDNKSTDKTLEIVKHFIQAPDLETTDFQQPVNSGNTRIKINPKYYAERDVDEHEAKNLLTKCNSINMVGEKTISLATSLGIGSEKSIRRIEGIPFLLVFKM